MKQRLRPMLGLKSFESATIVISGIELAEKIKKGAIQIWQTRRGRGDDAGDLASRVGSVIGVGIDRDPRAEMVTAQCQPRFCT